MKTVKLILLLLGFGALAIAQNPDKKPNEKLESMKIAMITNRLDLSTEQSSTFWPVYKEYDNKKKDLMMSLKQHFGESSSLANSDEKIMAELKEISVLRQKQVDLDKEYMTKLLKVIKPRQLVELYRAEHQFKQMLLRRLDQPNQLSKSMRDQPGKR
jgi:hypothetical protein